MKQNFVVIFVTAIVSVVCTAILARIAMDYRGVTEPGACPPVIETHPQKPPQPLSPPAEKKPVMAYRVHYHCPQRLSTPKVSDYRRPQAKYDNQALAGELYDLGFLVTCRHWTLLPIPGNNGPFDSPFSQRRETLYWVEYQLDPPRYKDFSTMSEALRLKTKLDRLNCTVHIETVCCD